MGRITPEPGGTTGGGGGSGTVTAVSSTDASITVANPTTTPALTPVFGTALHTIAQGNDARIVGAAPLASPALTGTPTAPTATAGTNTTQIATTAFVQSASYVPQTGSGSPVGVVTPAAAGATYTDTATGTEWVATSTSNTSWRMVSTRVYPAGTALDLGGTRDMVTATSTTVTSATAAWKNGQVLVIRGGNAAGATYIGTITAGGGTTSVTVSPATTASASGLTGFYGTDDTGAWQTALKATPVGGVVDAGAFRSLIRQQNLAAGTTNASATVTCAGVTAAMAGLMVTATDRGIPANTFVGTVSAGVSFTLVDKNGNAVNATTTNAGNTVCVGGLWVPPGVHLLTEGRGPFDPQQGAGRTILGNPAMTTQGPTFGIVQSAPIGVLGLDMANPMIGLTDGAGLGDTIVYSLNQLDPTNATPTNLAAVISTIAHDTTLGYFGNVAGCRIGHVLLPNCFNGVALNGERHWIEHLMCGAFSRALTIDHSQDFNHIRVLHVWPYYRFTEGQTYAPAVGNFDAYVGSNLWTVEIGRADSFDIDRLSIFNTYGGVLMNDSADATQAPKCGYGTIGRADIDTCTYGLYAVATEVPLICGTLLAFGHAPGSGYATAAQYAVYTSAGGSVAPAVVVKGWSWRGSFIAGSGSAAGTLVVPGTNPG